jgi:hypothetical protein
MQTWRLPEIQCVHIQFFFAFPSETEAQKAQIIEERHARSDILEYTSDNICEFGWDASLTANKRRRINWHVLTYHLPQF